LGAESALYDDEQGCGCLPACLYDDANVHSYKSWFELNDCPCHGHRALLKVWLVPSNGPPQQFRGSLKPHARRATKDSAVHGAGEVVGVRTRMNARVPPLRTHTHERTRSTTHRSLWQCTMHACVQGHCSRMEWRARMLACTHARECCQCHACVHTHTHTHAQALACTAASRHPILACTRVRSLIQRSFALSILRTRRHTQSLTPGTPGSSQACSCRTTTTTRPASAAPHQPNHPTAPTTSTTVATPPL